MKSFRLDRLIAGVELSGSGEWIVLQETPDGVTILEAWRFPVDCAAEDCPGRLSAVLRRAGGEPWVTNANQAPERREILRLS